MTSAIDRDAHRLANLAAAWAVAVADRVHETTAAAAGRGAQAPAALVALREFSDGRSIEHLRSVLGLTHSATVRLVDNLEAAGFVKRRHADGDGRAIAVTLTAAGRRHADAVERARGDAMLDALAELGDDDRGRLTAILERLVADLTTRRLQARQRGELPAVGWLCRLCDFDACGRDRGECPAASTAASHQSSARGQGET